MKRKRLWVVRAFLLFFLAGTVVLTGSYVFDSSRWATSEANARVYADGKVTNVGTITDRNGTLLVSTSNGVRTYNDDKTIRKATLHAVGDLNGKISTGIQAQKLSQLMGYNEINGIYGETQDIQLTLDANLCAAALKALGSHAGTVGVYNYKTGELLAMVSTPTYDIEDEKQAEAAKNGTYKGVYINRFLSSVYAPGSTFKIITAAAALKTYGDAAYDVAFTCHNGVDIDGETLSCLGNHKTLTLAKAFSQSCNSYFSQLALKLGKNTMTAQANACGFNRIFKLNGIAAAKPVYAVNDARQIDFGWSGIGQYTDMMNPLQYLTMVGAIANGGKAVNPYIIDGTWARTTSFFSAEVAEGLHGLMRQAVKTNYGDYRFGSLTVCGKTGTAEVGKTTEPHSEFVGFCEDADKPYAIVVVVENAGAGSCTALPVAGTVLKACPSIN